MSHISIPTKDKLVIKGARVHNLKNLNLEIPKNAMVVFTGLSGSGKSSLAFDTIFAEGQRRYVESLSAYARQFLGPRGSGTNGTILICGGLLGVYSACSRSW